ncbi:MAG TPA: hypothetical protein VF861_05855 [Telluria sp.]
MKSKSTTRVLAASALFAGLLAGCTSMQGDQGGSGAAQGSTAAAGGTGMSPTNAECAQFHQYESRRTPSTQQELVDPQLARMSPEERERHMNMMRERCGPGPSSPPPKY